MDIYIGWKVQVPQCLREYFGKDNLCHLMFYLMLSGARNSDMKAYDEFNGKRYKLKRGQCLFSRKTYTEYLCSTEDKVRLAFKKLEDKYGVISVSKSKNYSVVTIKNYDDFMSFKSNYQKEKSPSRLASNSKINPQAHQKTPIKNPMQNKKNPQGNHTQNTKKPPSVNKKTPKENPTNIVRSNYALEDSNREIIKRQTVAREARCSSFFVNVNSGIDDSQLALSLLDLDSSSPFQNENPEDISDLVKNFGINKVKAAMIGLEQQYYSKPNPKSWTRALASCLSQNWEIDHQITAYQENKEKKEKLHLKQFVLSGLYGNVGEEAAISYAKQNGLNNKENLDFDTWIDSVFFEFIANEHKEIESEISRRLAENYFNVLPQEIWTSDEGKIYKSVNRENMTNYFTVLFYVKKILANYTGEVKEAFWGMCFDSDTRDIILGTMMHQICDETNILNHLSIKKEGVKFEDSEALNAYPA